MESKSLEGLVEKENSLRVIPRNLFEGRDFIPLYGIGSSLRKAGKEFIISCVSYEKSSFTDIIKRDLRIILRAAEFIVVGAYNLGLFGLGLSVYNSITN